jgi:hypothetical protein
MSDLFHVEENEVPAKPPVLSPKRRAVLEYLRLNTIITIPEAVSLIGRNVYANRAFHCGNVLRAMCDAGLIQRIDRGIYSLPGMPMPADLARAERAGGPTE